LSVCCKDHWQVHPGTQCLPWSQCTRGFRIPCVKSGQGRHAIMVPWGITTLNPPKQKAAMRWHWLSVKES
jgi:hypothetical protein